MIIVEMPYPQSGSVGIVSSEEQTLIALMMEAASTSETSVNFY
jgi:hypothetical protein